MSAKAIREASGKDLINRHLNQNGGAAKCRFASVDENTNWTDLIAANPWLETTVSRDIFFLYINKIRLNRNSFMYIE